MTTPTPWTRAHRDRARADLRTRIKDHDLDFFVTLSFNASVPPGRARKAQMLKEWDARLNRVLIGPKWFKRPDERMVWFAFQEKPDVHPHFHLLVDLDPQLKLRRRDVFAQLDFAYEVDSAWRRVCPPGSTNTQPYRSERAIRYSTKAYDLAQDDDCFYTHLDFLRAG